MHTPLVQRRPDNTTLQDTNCLAKRTVSLFMLCRCTPFELIPGVSGAERPEDPAHVATYYAVSALVVRRCRPCNLQHAILRTRPIGILDCPLGVVSANKTAETTAASRTCAVRVVGNVHKSVTRTQCAKGFGAVLACLDPASRLVCSAAPMLPPSGSSLDQVHTVSKVGAVLVRRSSWLPSPSSHPSVPMALPLKVEGPATSIITRVTRSWQNSVSELPRESPCCAALSRARPSVRGKPAQGPCPQTRSETPQEAAQRIRRCVHVVCHSHYFLRVFVEA